jgi:predicted GIY-YIG superfamily endonuclease
MTLYTGVTNDLQRRGRGAQAWRVQVHKPISLRPAGFLRGFRFNLGAIAAEKRIKGKTRAKKIALIKALNPTWCDLSSR